MVIMNSQWLSLTEYSSKYQISISTLRRKIRAGKIPVNIQLGKYFLKDQAPASFKSIQPEESTISSPTFEKKAIDFVTDSEEETKNKPPLNKKPELLDKLMNTQQTLYKKLEQQDLKLQEKTEEIMQLNTLVALLEKENKELKNLLYQEKEIEEWLEIK